MVIDSLAAVLSDTGVIMDNNPEISASVPPSESRATPFIANESIWSYIGFTPLATLIE